MNRPVLQCPPALAIRRFAEDGVTARLVARRGEVLIRVYLERGALVAAQASDDGPRLARLMRLSGGMRAERLAELTRDRTSLAAKIVEEAEPVALERALVSMFDENLGRFLATEAVPRFEPIQRVAIAAPTISGSLDTLLARGARVAERMRIADFTHREELGPANASGWTSLARSLSAVLGVRVA